MVPGRPEIAEDLAVAFEAATGPLGTWKRVKGADNLWQAARQAARWIEQTRPELTGLGQLSAADASMLAHSFRVPSGEGLTATLRALLRYSPVVKPAAQQALARMLRNRGTSARQPYSAEEFEQISVLARGIVRRARDRLFEHWQSDAAGHAEEVSLPSAHLSLKEAWGFGVLLAGADGDEPVDTVRVAGTAPACHSSRRARDRAGGRGQGTPRPALGPRFQGAEHQQLDKLPVSGRFRHTCRAENRCEDRRLGDLRPAPRVGRQLRVELPGQGHPLLPRGG
ncbi:hypothetical protein [Catenulispora subtropica]|uniref:DUF222 domain-containing protein n=1 Tax=Catenulispora subtropica TaxID=450798 RepID=A0ABN2S1V6_9ACTN